LRGTIITRVPSKRRNGKILTVIASLVIGG